jgi:hypothetical protein
MISEEDCIDRSHSAAEMLANINAYKAGTLAAPETAGSRLSRDAAAQATTRL